MSGDVSRPDIDLAIANAIKRIRDLEALGVIGCCDSLQQQLDALGLIVGDLQLEFDNTPPPSTIFEGVTANNINYNSAFYSELAMTTYCSIPNYDFFISLGYDLQLRFIGNINPNGVTIGAAPHLDLAGQTNLEAFSTLPATPGYVDTDWHNRNTPHDVLSPHATVDFAVFATGTVFIYDAKLYARWVPGGFSGTIPPGLLSLADSLRLVTAKTTNYTLTGADDMITMDASGGARTVTLPSVSVTPWTPGKAYLVKKVDSSGNAVTLSQSADGEKIDGANTKVLAAQWNWIEVVRDQSIDWLIISSG